jgi:hypothetical protein
MWRVSDTYREVLVEASKTTGEFVVSPVSLGTPGLSTTLKGTTVTAYDM